MAGLRLLAAAPEDERIAAFQPHDIVPGQRLAHQQRVDLMLLQGVAARGSWRPRPAAQPWAPWP